MHPSLSVCAVAAALLALCGCGDPVKSNVQVIMSGGEGREQALMELLFARADALPAIFTVLEDTSQPARGRADLVEVLWKLYIRESHPAILPVLTRLIGDPAPRVREAVARALGDMEKKDPVHPLLARLEVEQDEAVQLQILVALEILDGWEIEGLGGSGAFTIAGGEELSPEEKVRFTQRLKTIYEAAPGDSLRQQAEEFLEKIVGQQVQGARKFVLQANLEKAEALLQEALRLKPDSWSALMRLGKFYYFNGQPERGLELLTQHGMVLRIPPLPQAPILDGDLDDPAWARAAKIDRFYQNIDMMRVVPTEGRTEACIGYTDTSICVAVKGYEEDTQNLVARHTTHDSNVWLDDCVEVFFDPDLDQRTFYQIVANTLGVMFDIEYSADDDMRGTDSSKWNGEQRVATRVEPTFWTLEMEIPLRSLGAGQVQQGDVWGFNLVRARIGKAAEHGAWMPPYGYSGRPDWFGLLVFD